MKRKYASQWTDNIDVQGEVDRFEEHCRLSLPALLRVVELIDRELSRQLEDSENPDRYKLAGWAEYQADAIGYRRGLKFVRKLIKTLDK